MSDESFVNAFQKLGLAWQLVLNVRLLSDRIPGHLLYRESHTFDVTNVPECWRRALGLVLTTRYESATVATTALGRALLPFARAFVPTPAYNLPWETYVRAAIAAEAASGPVPPPPPPPPPSPARPAEGPSRGDA